MKVIFVGKKYGIEKFEILRILIQFSQGNARFVGKIVLKIVY